MVILSLCGDKYNHPSDKLGDMTFLDRAWKRAADRVKRLGGNVDDTTSAPAPAPANISTKARTAA
ncbi:hypothetical protein N825_26195 [Skermanella stibiiresistens SB22]|uniref:Uncharacterized protein n=1 Tax=Skermanella stibiiresistens SB22 TaxID=1385369 RepID=W9GY15_9PROT|nr:hypothetical protein [Skermanella stibiiresistens]EWY36373.1 hypothetical protein N825_26195 [Skermanella stibiiresistens SB22]